MAVEVNTSQMLSVKAWTITVAILWGTYLFFAPIFATANLNTFWFSNKMFDMLASIYPGLSASFGGAFIGLIYGAICGGICGWLFAAVHNWSLKTFK